nr:helix-turn-helix domain-containing protein [Saccharothrix deserti]
MFSTELHRCRTAAALSQSALAKKIPCTTSHVSRLESGERRPSLRTAIKCDQILSADNALIRAAAEQRSQTEVHKMKTLWSNASNPDDPTMIAYDALLSAYQKRGQQRPPAEVLESVGPEARLLLTLADKASAADRRLFLSAAAKFSEYAGWLAQEKGDDRLAVKWIDRTASLADRLGDRDLASYMLIRKALIAFYTDNSAITITLAEQAQGDTRVSPRVRGLAAVREAQGHALAHDEYQCERALDRARRLLDAPSGHTPAFGSRHVPGLVATAEGWCRHDLGDHLRAATTLAEELARIPAQAARARARFGVRMLLAQAEGDQVDQVCAQAEPILDDAQQVDSATIRIDLRHLNRALGRFHRQEGVAEICRRISSLLSPAIPPAESA